MINKINNCCFEHKGTNASASERGKSFLLENRSKVLIKKVDVDKCVYKDNTTDKRCDYLFQAETKRPKVFFVELKGCDLSSGIDQIHSSLLALKEYFLNHMIEARLITNRPVPDLRTRRTFVEIKRITKTSGGDFLIRNNGNYSEII